jgi:recombinational DNA repair ATPase RecF
MKIKSIRISGFRGIPPIEPPHVDISLLKGNEPQNVLIFGPNAYGKSSISSALEWFFRENVHCSEYFEDYSASDNVHIHVGKTGYPATGFIEINVVDGGVETTIRKEIDENGKKINEITNGLEQLLGLCKNEIITLDHDEFRNFVSAASKDKWATFSSLIGYEELDNFRSGLDSLSQRSLSDNLRVSALEKEKSAKEKSFNSSKSQICSNNSLPAKSELSVIEDAFIQQLNLVLLSLQYPTYRESNELTEATWVEILSKVSPSEGYKQNTQRLGQLKRLLTDITPFSEKVIADLNGLKEKSLFLDSKKSQFDKSILDQFYKLGLEIIQTKRTTLDECPFCRNPINWESLKSQVDGFITDLEFAEINTQSEKLIQIWDGMKSALSFRIDRMRSYELKNIANMAAVLSSTSVIDHATKLSTFDAAVIMSWADNLLLLQKELAKTTTNITDQIDLIEKGLKSNPEGQLSNEIASLYTFWKNILALKEEKGKLAKLEREIEVTKGVIDQIRSIAKNFRSELEDFSGRVIEVINEDVKKYYDALHPNDNIRPFLETQVDGSKRKVLLKCDYKGYEGKDAASLLSESHRNSLGLAVLLAFMKYKRQTGSPVEFMILDDVTQSFDVGHRSNLVNFLEDPDFPEICSNQIILLTHDRTLADFIQRPGEIRDNWLRYDIRSWHLNALVIEPNNHNLLNVAKDYLNRGDEMAAAIYARHALEQIFKSIAEGAKLSLPYSSKPWSVKLNAFQIALMKEVKRLWSLEVQKNGHLFHRGVIDPQRFQDKKLTTSLRILNLTVHESDFLDNPPSAGDIQSALDAIEELRNMFTCPICRQHRSNPTFQYFPSLDRGAHIGVIKCKKCEQPLPPD